MDEVGYGPNLGPLVVAATAGDLFAGSLHLTYNDLSG